MESKGIKVNRDYLMSQMDVLQNEIKTTEEGPNQNLYSAISSRLNRYVEVLQYEQGTEEAEKQIERSKICIGRGLQTR